VPLRLLAVRPARGDRLRLVFEGGEDILLSRERVLLAGLREGVLLREEEVERLATEAAGEDALRRALRYLETRERSAKELSDRLRRYGYQQELVQATVDRCRELGYLDDRRFAGMYVREKTRTGWGPRRLRAELARKGVARDIVDEAVGEPAERQPSGVFDDQTGLEQLVQTVTKKFGPQLRSDPRRARSRAAGFLSRRGHDWEVVDSILREVQRRLELAPDEQEGP
jgi:regulatory protein